MVLILLNWVTIPPTVTQSPSRRSASSASVLSALARSAGPTSLSGWAEMNRPSDSFSAASISVRSNSSPGIGAWLGPANGSGAAGVAAGGSGGAEVEDRALADERVLLGLLAGRLGLLEHRQHPLAGGVGRAERAALDQRLDRLLVDRAVVDALAEVEQAGERTRRRSSSPRARLIASTAW